MTEFKSFLRHLPAWLPSWVCILIILYLTLAAKPLGENEIELFPNADKVVHAIMFGGLTATLWFDKWRKDSFHLPSLGFMLWSASGVILFGGLIEILQLAMHAGRSADLLDFISDSIGVVLVVLIYLSIRSNDR